LWKNGKKNWKGGHRKPSASFTACDISDDTKPMIWTFLSTGKATTCKKNGEHRRKGH